MAVFHQLGGGGIVIVAPVGVMLPPSDGGHRHDHSILEP